MNSDMWEKKVKDNINASLKVDDKIDNIVGTINPFYGTVNTVDNFGLYAEGIITGTVIYMNKEGEMKSVAGEFPYQILIDKETSSNELKTLSNINITDCEAKIKAENEIELNMNAAVTVKGMYNKNISVIEDIEEGEEKISDDIAISLYITKEGENLWDVAKMLSTDEDTLLKLNPDIELPLKSGEKLLLYRELNL